MRPAARPGLSIRAKVALLSTLLLTIPYVGYQYVREMEAYLRDGLEVSVLGAARALAAALHDRPDLLGPQLLDTSGDDAALYVHALRNPVQVDGYVSDWIGYREWMEPVGDGAAGGDLDARFVAGKHGGYLYLLVEVIDDDLVYQRGPGASAEATNDRLRIAVRDARGERRAWTLTTPSPGWVSAYETRRGGRYDQLVRLEPRIRAEWQEMPGGWRVEMRIPVALAGPALGIAVDDVDRGERAARRAVGPGAGRDGLAPLLLPSAAIEGLIRNLGRTEGRRVWVVDRRGRVVARGGSLERDAPPPAISPLFALVLRPPSAELLDDEPVLARLRGPEIDAALAGEDASRWRATREPELFVVAAAHPVWNGTDVAGAVVVEETSLGIQTVRRQALANLFTTTLVVCLAGGLVLLLFATRISVRLGRLRDETERAIDAHGRVVGDISESRAGDEIGSLARSFGSMMGRLREYNSYLELLARRLSHELRTPITVVRSSLESLAMGPGAAPPETYVERAREGLARLDSIISRMSEASRLEEAVASAEPEVFDLADVVGAAVEAYRETWPDTAFAFERTPQACPVRGAPDLAVQMLDKVVANAREFRTGEAPIAVRVARRGPRVRLAVENRGPVLPDGMRSALFESMVSVRDGRDPAVPHLGLGLYIVRLIAEYHGGGAHAENLEDGGGVRVVVDLPAQGNP